jgi:general secretion pathway protein K
MSPKRRTLRKRRKKRADERGVALILVLGAITVLTVFLTQLQEETTSDLAAALAERDALKAEYLARSAVNLSRLLIATEPSIRATVGPMLQLMGLKSVPQIPVWGFTDLVLGPFNDAASTQGFLSTIGGDPTLAKNLGLTGGHFEVLIVEEDGKVNVNLAARNEIEPRDRLGRQLLGLFAPPENAPMFEGRDADGQFSDMQTICGAIVDWADSDTAGNEQQYMCDPFSQTASHGGAEDSFYQTIGLPYVRKNAAYDSLEELRLVRGISDDFWATFVDPDPANPKKRIMTVWGQTELNVNSASPQTLLALICGNVQNPQNAELCTDVSQMQMFLIGMEMGKQLTMGLPLFGTPGDFLNALKGQGIVGQILEALPTPLKPLTLSTTEQKLIRQAISTSTKRFSIYADGVVPGYKRTTKVRVTAVVDFRDAGKIGPLGSVQVAGGDVAAMASAAQAAAAANGVQTTQGLQKLANQTTQSPDDIISAMNSNPAGTIIYWRVE